MISAPTRHHARAAVLVGAIVALMLLPGLVPIGVAEPAPPVRFRPTQLPLGAEPVPAWVASAHGDQLDDELRRAGRKPISLAMPDAAPLSVREARGGWLVEYVVWDRPVVAPHRLVLVRRDGTKRVVAQRTNPVQVVSEDGVSYVTKREVLDSRQRRTATVLSSVRIDDGNVYDRLRFRGPDMIRVRSMTSYVMADRVAPATRGGDRRVTTIEWRPASGRVTTRWRRTAHPTDLPGIGRLSMREIVVPDRRKGQGQTVADLASQRNLWRLRVGERAMRFGHGKLLTLTDKAGPDDVRTLRVRAARTGRLLATYRGTIFDSYVRWESSRRFVIMAADGLEPYDGPGGGSAWSHSSLVRCATGAAGCERVDAEFDYTSISVAPGTTY